MTAGWRAAASDARTLARVVHVEAVPKTDVEAILAGRMVRIGAEIGVPSQVVKESRDGLTAHAVKGLAPRLQCHGSRGLLCWRG